CCNSPCWLLSLTSEQFAQSRLFQYLAILAIPQDLTVEQGSAVGAAVAYCLSVYLRWTRSRGGRNTAKSSRQPLACRHRSPDVPTDATALAVDLNDTRS